MNFGGTGFAFAVKDKGSLSFSDRLAKSFGGVTDAVRRMGSSGDESSRLLAPLQGILRTVNEMLSVDRVQAWMSAFGGRQLHDAREALSQLTGAHMNLTTGFEAEQQQIGQASRQAAANAGFAGEAFQRVSRMGASLAGSLNRGAAETTGAAVAWENAGQYLRAAGIRSARDLVLIQDTHQVNAGTLADFARTAQMSLRLTGDQTSRIIGEYQRAGAAFGGVGNAINQLTPLMDNLNQEAAAMGVSLNTERMTAMAVGTARYGQALYTAGIRGEHAQSAMHALNTTLLQGRQGMQNLVMGVGSELPQMLEGLSIAGGDVNQAMTAMSEGPDQFVRTLGSMVTAVRASGRNVDAFMQHLNTRLTASGMGADEVASLMTLLRSTGTRAMESLSQTSDATSAALVQSARRGFSTGRTLEESFNRSRDAALASFRAIGRGEATQLIGSMGREFGALNARVREVVADGGPLAMLATRLSAAHQIGALAFIPQGLRPIGLLMGQLGSEIGPVLTSLYTMGFRLTMLMSPLTPLLIALGFLGMRFADLVIHGRSASQALTQIASEVGTFFDDLPSVVDRGMTAFGRFLEGLANSASAVDWTALWERISTSIGRSAVVFYEKLQPHLRRIGGWVLEGIGQSLDRLSTTIQGVDWARVWPRVIGSARAVVSNAVGTIREVFSAFWRSFTSEAFSAMPSDLGSLSERAMRIVLGEEAEAPPQALSERFANAVSNLVLSAGTSIRSAAVELWPHLREGVTELFDEAGPRLQELAAELGPQVVSGLQSLVTAAQTQLPPLLTSLWDSIMEAAPNVGEFAGEAATWVGLALAAVATRIPGFVAEWGPRILEGAQRMLGGLTDLAESLLSGVLQGVENVLVRVFPQSAGTIRETISTLREGLGVVADIIRAVIAAVGPLLTGAVQGTWTFLTRAFSAVSGLVSSMVSGITDVVTGIVMVVRGVFGNLLSMIAAPFEFAWGQLRAGYDLVVNVGGALRTMFSDPQEGLRQLGAAFTDFFASTVANVRTYITTLVTNFVGFFTNVGGGLLRIGRGFGEMFDGVLNFARGWGEAISGFFTGLFDGIVGAVAAFFVSFLGTWAAELNTVDTRVSEWMAAGRQTFTDFLAGVVNLFVGMGTSVGEVWTGIQTRVSEVFTGVVGTVRDGIAQASGFVTGFKDHFLEALNGVWGRVMSLFGNSVHDVVGDDLTQTNAVSSQWSSTFQQHATEAFDSVTTRQGDVTATAAQFRTALASGLTEALVGAFTTGYARILLSTDAFTRDSKVKMFRLATDIFTRFQLLWQSLADLAVVTLATIGESTAEAARGLATLQRQQAQAGAVQTSVVTPEGPRRAVNMLGRQLQNGQAQNTDLFAAIHEPDWYQRDYQRRFDQRMAELKEAVLSLRGTQPGAPRQSARTREEAAAVARLAAAGPRLTGGLP